MCSPYFRLYTHTHTHKVCQSYIFTTVPVVWQLFDQFSVLYVVIKVKDEYDRERMRKPKVKGKSLFTEGINCGHNSTEDSRRARDAQATQRHRLPPSSPILSNACKRRRIWAAPDTVALHAVRREEEDGRSPHTR